MFPNSIKNYFSFNKTRDLTCAIVRVFVSTLLYIFFVVAKWYNIFLKNFNIYFYVIMIVHKYFFSTLTRCILYFKLSNESPTLNHISKSLNGKMTRVIFI